jgi:hypothetical protein
VLALATAVSLLALALVLLLTPAWTHWAISAAGGTRAATSPGEVLALSDRTIAELLVGPGTFVDFRPDEAAHLRDARLALWSFLALAGVSATFVGVTLWRSTADASVWRAVGRGGAALAAALVVVGVFAVLAFDAAFELFHRLLFPGGNYTFDASSRLVQLYPLGFWQLCAAAMGVLGIAGGLLVWRLASGRAARLEPA